MSNDKEGRVELYPGRQVEANPSQQRETVKVDWSKIMEEMLSRYGQPLIMPLLQDQNHRFLFGDPELRDEPPLQGSTADRVIIDDPIYDTGSPEYQKALRFFSEKNGSISWVKHDEAAELRETVALLKAKLAAADEEISRLKFTRARDKAIMLAEMRCGNVRHWVGQLHNGDFWKQTEVGDVATGYLISTTEASAFCHDAKGEPREPSKPSHPSAEALARAFASDGLLDGYGRPR